MTESTLQSTYSQELLSLVKYTSHSANWYLLQKRHHFRRFLSYKYALLRVPTDFQTWGPLLI